VSLSWQTPSNQLIIRKNLYIVSSSIIRKNLYIVSSSIIRKNLYIVSSYFSR